MASSSNARFVGGVFEKARPITKDLSYGNRLRPISFSSSELLLPDFREAEFNMEEVKEVSEILSSGETEMEVVDVLCRALPEQETVCLLFPRGDDMLHIIGVHFTSSKVILDIRNRLITVEILTKEDYFELCNSTEYVRLSFHMENLTEERRGKTFSTEESRGKTQKPEFAGYPWIDVARSILDHFAEVGDGSAASPSTGESSLVSGSGGGVSGSGGGLAGRSDSSVDRTSANVEEHQESRLIIIIICRGRDAVNHKWNEDVGRYLLDSTTDLLRISEVKPVLTMEFFHQEGLKFVNATVEAQFQVSSAPMSEGMTVPEGWFQDQMELSFRIMRGCSQPDDLCVSLDSSSIESPMVDREIQRTHIRGSSIAAHGDINFLSSLTRLLSAGTYCLLQGLTFVLQTVGLVGVSAQRTRSDTSAVTLRKKVLSDFPTVEVIDNSLGNRLHYLGFKRYADSSPEESNVCYRVRSRWEILDEGMHAYEFLTRKQVYRSLTKSYPSHFEGIGSSLYERWIEDDASGSLRTLPNSVECPWIQTVTQEFQVNHNLEEFLPTHARPTPYRWRLATSTISPVPSALRM